MPAGEFILERVLTGQVRRHFPVGSRRNFDDRLADPEPGLRGQFAQPRMKSWLFTSGSARKTGSTSTTICVIISPLRTKYSVMWPDRSSAGRCGAPIPA